MSAPGTRDPVRAEAFAIWLRDRVERHLFGARSIEVEADLPEGAIARILRGGGAPHGLTRPMVSRLAWALKADEGELLVRTGHVAAEPCPVPLDEAILGRDDLDPGAKLLLVALAARLSAPRPREPRRYFTAADRRAARGDAFKRLALQAPRRRRGAGGGGGADPT